MKSTPSVLKSLWILIIVIGICNTSVLAQKVKVEAPLNSAIVVNGFQRGVVLKSPTMISTGTYYYGDLQIKKEGYKTEYDVLKSKSIKAELTPLPNFKNSNKQVRLVNLSLDSTVAHSKKWFSSEMRIKQPAFHKPDTISTERKFDIIYSEAKIFDRLQEKLKLYNMSDTSSLLFNRHGDLSVSVNVSDLEWIEYQFNKKYNYTAKYCNVIAVYQVKDQAGKSIFKDTISTRSGDFWLSVLDFYIITDALEYGLIELLANEEVTNAISSEAPYDFLPDLESIGVSVKEGKTDPLEILEHAYYLTTEDEKILGLPVGEDGVLVFPKSSLTFIDDYKITDQDGKEYEGKPILDMALSELTFIQIDQKFDKTFSLRTSELDLVEHIYLIGADIYYKSAILSEGIVGGKRNTDDHLTYQTDAESGHMIWPFAIDENGNICGVITRDVDASSMAFFPSIKLIE